MVERGTILLGLPPHLICVEFLYHYVLTYIHFVKRVYMCYTFFYKCWYANSVDAAMFKALLIEKQQQQEKVHLTVNCLLVSTQNELHTFRS